MVTTGPQRQNASFDDWQNQRATMRAWEDYLTFRDPARSQTSGVRREILESWSRSLASGIDASSELAPMTDGEDLLEAARLQNADLCGAAQRPFAKIGPLLSEASAMLILTDAEGLVLQQIGDMRTLAAARGIHLTLGGKWKESAIGTNGIGMALRTGQPTVVHASEHFCQGIKAWTCAAAPIHDPVDKRIVGVVDLSGPPSIFRPHNVAMIAAIACEIEAALAERQEARRARLLEAYIEAGSTPSKDDAVVILDWTGRVMYHRAPQGGGEPQRDLALGRQLIALSDRMSDSDIAAAMPPHLQPSGVSRLSLDGRFSGAVLMLPSLRTLQQRSNRPAVPLKIPARAGAAGDELLMIGQDPRFLEAVSLARRAAAAGTAVLVQGETGSGKELFARLIHAEGKHKGRAPFVTLNCGAISADLFGSELFGHVAGAFTGATRDGKAGKFEQADGGVLCLDEIGELPLDLQPYLLRVLEQRAVYRIGCTRRRQVDVQLVAMTNRNLGQELETGRFRRDLYYRIGIVTIDVPPLRERAGDILHLAEHFNTLVSERMGRQPLRFSDAAVARMQAYAWPGNIRELRNLLERLHLTATGSVVEEDHLPTVFRQASPVITPAPVAPGTVSDGPASLTDVEAQAIRRALVSEDGNLTRVAEVLGISRPTLYRKLKTYGIRRSFE